MAKVPAAGAHHPEDGQAGRLQTAFARIDLRARNTHEGGYRRVEHWSESSSKPQPAALSQPCIVQGDRDDIANTKHMSVQLGARNLCAAFWTFLRVVAKGQKFP
ncbi:hypothetical protein [Roseovarius sp. MBR-6]|jgi:hypothetical protein|uniref:hypothetical protein n=1 Tax=Roseovarius sp. MBR-6 TaxID=3156459 RepID=UPI003397AEDF